MVQKAFNWITDDAESQNQCTRAIYINIYIYWYVLIMIVIIIICMYSLKVCTAAAVCNFHEENFPFFSVNILLSEPYLRCNTWRHNKGTRKLSFYPILSYRYCLLFPYFSFIDLAQFAPISAWWVLLGTTFFDVL